MQVQSNNLIIYYGHSFIQLRKEEEEEKQNPKKKKRKGRKGCSKGAWANGKQGQTGAFLFSSCQHPCALFPAIPDLFLSPPTAHHTHPHTQLKEICSFRTFFTINIISWSPLGPQENKTGSFFKTFFPKKILQNFKLLLVIKFITYDLRHKKYSLRPKKKSSF